MREVKTGSRARRAGARAVAARARRRRSAVDAARERARRARQLVGDVGGARGRPAVRRRRVRAQRRSLTRARVEREAAGHVRRAQATRPLVPVQDGGARPRHAGRDGVARRPLPQGFRRPDAHERAARPARAGDRRGGDHARRRTAVRRRDVVRREARRAGLEARLPDLRVPAALGARRRSRGLRRAYRAEACARRGGDVPPAAARLRRDDRTGRDRPRAGVGDGARRRASRRRCAT